MTQGNNIFLAGLPSRDNRQAMIQRIDQIEAKRSSLIKVQWTHIDDLHITLGYIKNVDPKDVQSILIGFTRVNEYPMQMLNVEEVKIYGTAIVLRLEPQHKLKAIHKQLNQKLQDLSNDRYHFEGKNHFDAHLTLGRVRNWPVVNFQQKQQFMELIKSQFLPYAFLMQQAALMCRISERAKPAYHQLKLYNLSR